MNRSHCHSATAEHAEQLSCNVEQTILLLRGTIE
jgi:hypothetical protein